MKKLMLIIAVSMVSVLHAKTFKTAVEYNNFLVGEQKSVIEKINAVYDILNKDFDEKQAWKAHKMLVKQCDLAIKNVTKATAFENNEDFKKASLDLLNCYHDYTNNGLAEIIGIYANTNRTQADVDRFNALVDTFELLEGLNLLLFEYAQEDFANANNFTVAK